jgi:hypothetical protein
LSLEARPLDEKVLLEWRTASEFNSAFFGVERSPDGVRFQEIGRVNAAGDALVDMNYQFLDPAPLDGTSYYRLQKVDRDGSGAPSHMVAVTMGRQDGLVVYPNPVLEELWVELQINTKSPLLWRISDNSGRMVDSGPLQGLEGPVREGLNVSRLDAGVYLLEILEPSGAFVGIARFVKQ